MIRRRRNAGKSAPNLRLHCRSGSKVDTLPSGAQCMRQELLEGCAGSPGRRREASQMPSRSGTGQPAPVSPPERPRRARGRAVSRRRVMALAGASAARPRVHIRGANAAGKLSVGFWDHWVANANALTEALVREWAEREKVEVSIDFITSQGNKLLLTTAAENQARSGHDILAMSTWLPAEYARNLEPVNDLMGPLIKQNGKANATVEYLCKVDGKWIAIPATITSRTKGSCSRM